ncbi:HesA/MoeB/ThiF family protein [Vibrio bivalvicida]|uniref:ThiF family adenylyltransferase n=1 Tax=Vibrio bivalvicida TaxID=1276888 RepID=A0ABV4MPF2_9VIBR
MFKLANYVAAGRYMSGGVFGIGSNQVFIDDKNEWETIVKVSSLIKEFTSLEQLTKSVASHYPSINESSVSSIVSFLEENNFLIRNYSFDKDDRFSRNKLYYNFLGSNPDDFQKNISNSVVTVIGCGGIGNHIAYMLATSGVAKIILVDDDYIEISNLTRQVLFTESDVGKNKVDILERELKKRNSDVEIETIAKAVTSPGDIRNLEPSDLYVISADYPSDLMFWVNEACVEKEQPFVNVGYINDISLIGPFYIPQKTACFACQQVTPKSKDAEILTNELANIHSDFKPCTFPSVNGVAASYALGDIIKFLGGKGEINSANKRIGIHSMKPEIEIQDMALNPGCSVCAV